MGRDRIKGFSCLRCGAVFFKKENQAIEDLYHDQVYPHIKKEGLDPEEMCSNSFWTAVKYKLIGLRTSTKIRRRRGRPKGAKTGNGQISQETKAPPKNLQAGEEWEYVFPAQDVTFTIRCKVISVKATANNI